VPSQDTPDAPAGANQALQIFNFDGGDVRVVLVDGQPWWVASDVAGVLAVGRAHDAVRRLDDDEKGTVTIRTPGGPQNLATVSESGLYAMILTSRKPEAKRFKRWVTGEVLPALRKTGRYQVETSDLAIPQTLSEALRLAADALDQAAASRASEAKALARVEVLEVEVAAAPLVIGSYSLRQSASILNEVEGVSTGQNRLAALLRTFGMVDDSGQPYARHASHLVQRPRTYLHKRTNEARLGKPQTRVTARGLNYLIRRMGGKPIAIDSLPEPDDPPARGQLRLL
jgi:anti-repressor protein